MSQFIPNRPPLVDINKEELIQLIKRFTPEKLAHFIDVTDLKADTQEPKMKKMAEWAITHHCASVCVNPVESADILPVLLKGSGVKNCYVIDFPLGKIDIDSKAQQTEHVVKKNRELRGEGKGKMELDMVINVGRFKRDHKYALDEINAVCQAADGELVKVIVRSSELTEEEVWAISEIVAESKADFIKNSTGMDAFGALPDHMWIMRQVVGNTKGVKASGGISDAMTAMRLMWAAAKDPSLQTPDKFRFGSSGPLAIISTMGWLLHNTEGWVEAGIIPCIICPYHHTSKHRVDLREYSNKRCQVCQHKEFRKHKDF
ncbi:MAG: deoxyribose-phosphate aldolase [Bacteroidales bacterium]|nr:deoxyribose-phosphate aldolase [Bacteroidales bacterium]